MNVLMTGCYGRVGTALIDHLYDREVYDTTLSDAVLVTHEHVDHMHPPSYGPLLKGTDASIYAPETCFATPDYEGDLQVTGGRRCSVSQGAPSRSEISQSTFGEPMTQTQSNP